METISFKKSKERVWEKNCELINNLVFGKIMEKVQKHKKVKIVTNTKKRKYLIFEPDYHLTKWLKNQ